MVSVPVTCNVTSRRHVPARPNAQGRRREAARRGHAAPTRREQQQQARPPQVVQGFSVCKRFQRGVETTRGQGLGGGRGCDGSRQEARRAHAVPGHGVADGVALVQRAHLAAHRLDHGTQPGKGGRRQKERDEDVPGQPACRRAQGALQPGRRQGVGLNPRILGGRARGRANRGGRAPMFSLHCRTICNGTNVAMFRAAHPGKKMKKMLCWNRSRSVVDVGGRGGNAGVQQSRMALDSQPGKLNRAKSHRRVV